MMMTNYTTRDEITISKVENGYIVSTGHYTRVVEEPNTSEEFLDRASTLANVFLIIQEHHGVFNSKHNKHRLVIEVIEQ
jgi:hypothetical protein